MLRAFVLFLALLIAIAGSDFAVATRTHALGGQAPWRGRPEAQTVFPKIEDWDSLRIGLIRGPGFGSECPSYALEIFGNGKVVVRTIAPGSGKGPTKTAISGQMVGVFSNNFKKLISSGCSMTTSI